jgi:hypothetical protein
MANEKIIGFDYKDFLRDDKSWPQGVYQDDVVLIVNGKRYGDDDGLMADDIPNTATIEIETGDVMRGQERLNSLQEHFDNWKQDRDNDAFVVICPKRLSHSIIAMIQSAGGSVSLEHRATTEPVPKASSTGPVPKVNIIDKPTVVDSPAAHHGLHVTVLCVGGRMSNLEITEYCAPIAIEHGYNPKGRVSVDLPSQYGHDSVTYAVWYQDKQR